MRNFMLVWPEHSQLLREASSLRESLFMDHQDVQQSLNYSLLPELGVKPADWRVVKKKHMRNQGRGKAFMLFEVEVIGHAIQVAAWKRFLPQIA